MKPWFDDPPEQWIYAEQERVTEQWLVMVGGFVRARTMKRAQADRMVASLISTFKGQKQAIIQEHRAAVKKEHSS